MPRVPEAYLDARRRQILSAAHRCFAKRGIHQTTMVDVADEAGLSVGALYRYFDGKESLVEALAALGREQKQDALELLDSGGGVEALAAMVSRVMGLLDMDGMESAVRLDVKIWGEALDNAAMRSVVSDGLDALRIPISDYLAAERKAGRLRGDVDPSAAAATIVGFLAGIELQKAFNAELDVRACADFVSVLVGALRPSGV